jgi:hypothetical protein
LSESLNLILEKAMRLPSIVKYLESRKIMLEDIRFCKPDAQSGLTELFTQDTDASPKATVFHVRRLEVPQGVVIPFHLHGQREKYYTCRRQSFTEIIIVENGEFRRYPLQEVFDRVFVPPETPHALIHHHVTPCHIEVVTNSRVSDTIWEDQTEQLLKNEHLRK